MEEKQRVYRFDTYGPFELPLDAQEVIASKGLRTFWNAVEEQHAGLSEALGCYIFAVRSSSVFLPWYIGKTEKRSFKFESVQLHKLRHYEAALRKQPHGIPLLYLLPRLTEGGKFRKIWARSSPSVDNLERMLIGSALSINPELRNTRSSKHLTQTIVPGYINDHEIRTPAAQSLAAVLRRDGKEAPR